jgi:hypothetical protein
MSMRYFILVVALLPPSCCCWPRHIGGTNEPIHEFPADADQVISANQRAKLATLRTFPR